MIPYNRYSKFPHHVFFFFLFQCDEEVEKWQNRKRYQQNYEKLRQQFKDQSVHLEAIKAANERLKETIIRLERERFAMESKLKTVKRRLFLH